MLLRLSRTRDKTLENDDRQGLETRRANRGVGSGYVGRRKAKQNHEYRNKNGWKSERIHHRMPGIDPSTICHKLNVDPSIRPIKQKRRVFAPDRNQAISDEVKKLLMVGFIREIYYPDWLANVVMVKKSNGK